jgi:hypothetical protein
MAQSIANSCPGPSSALAIALDATVSLPYPLHTQALPPCAAEPSIQPSAAALPRLARST